MSEDFLSLTGKKILVTGASGGIGRAVAVLASKFGAQCVLWGRDNNRLSQSLSALSGDGHFFDEVDLTNLDSISESMLKASAKSAGIDAVINCAGVHSAVPLKVINSTEVQALMTLNLTSALSLAQAFRQKRIPKSHPSITMMSSVAGLVGQPGVSAYSASKGGIIALTRSLALELAGEGIRVNCVSPGAVRTNMLESLSGGMGGLFDPTLEARHPLGLGEPTDVAAAVLFLTSARAKWITGTNMVVDGGYTAS